MDEENIIYFQNPMNLNIEVVPVAHVVGIEVMGEVLIETKTKQKNRNSCIEKLEYYTVMTMGLIILLSFFAGIAILMLWVSDPSFLGLSKDSSR